MYVRLVVFSVILFVLLAIAKILVSRFFLVEIADPYAFSAVESVIALQWIVQIGIPVFMTQGTTTGRAVRRTLLISGGFDVLCLGLLWLFAFLKRVNDGQILLQALLTLAYSILFCLTLSCVPARFRARPSCRGWILLLLVGHSLLFVSGLLTATDHQEAADCTTVFSWSLYYLLYAALLWLAVRNDSTDGGKTQFPSARPKQWFDEKPHNKHQQLTDAEYWRTHGTELLGERAFLVRERAVQQGPTAGLLTIQPGEIVRGELIGAGQFGEVYRAQYHDTDVAVKVLRIRPDNKFTGIAGLTTECDILSQLRHPNIVRFLGLIAEPPDFSIVMEYAPHGDLYGLLHECTEPVPWRTRLMLMLGVAVGLNFLHRRQPAIIHRDLKSHNVLISSQFTAKLADFGGAMRKQFGAGNSVIGTPQWCAPEILREESYNERVDIWSFGAVLWETCTRQVPFADVSQLRVIFMVAQQQLHLPLPFHPKPLSDLTGRCFQQRPSDRPSSQALVKGGRIRRDKPEEGLVFPLRPFCPHLSPVLTALDAADWEDEPPASAGSLPAISLTQSINQQG